MRAPASSRAFPAVALLILVMIGLPAGGPRPVGATDGIEYRTCPVSILMVAAKSIYPKLRFICGFVSIPENYEQPAGRTIRSAFAIIRQSGDTPLGPPLVIAQGGPGGSSFELLLESFIELMPLGKGRDLLAVEMRGIDYSDPSLDCWETGAYIEARREGLANAYIRTALREGVKACYDRLTWNGLGEINPNDPGFPKAARPAADALNTEGIDLNAYNRIQSSTDIVSVSRALGYSQIDLYGVSYGGLLALEVMRLHPEILRTVILDSAVPPDINALWWSPLAAEQGLRNLFRSCARNQRCNSAYPNLERDFFATVQRLSEHPLEYEGFYYNHATLGPDVFVESVAQLLRNQTGWWQIPAMIDAVSRGDTSDFQPPSGNSINGVFISSSCAEFQPGRPAAFGIPWDAQIQDPANFAGWLRFRQLVAREPGNEIREMCQVWPVSQLPDWAFEPVQSSIRTLILTGGLDPIVPSSYATHLAGTLPNSTLVRFETGGHGLILEDCGKDIILSFLTNPGQVDLACLNDLPPMGFYRALPYHLAQDPEEEAMVRPPDGWQGSYEFFSRVDGGGLMTLHRVIGPVSVENVIARYLVYPKDYAPIRTVTAHGLVWQIYDLSAKPAPDSTEFFLAAIASRPDVSLAWFILGFDSPVTRDADLAGSLLPAIERTVR